MALPVEEQKCRTNKNLILFFGSLSSSSLCRRGHVIMVEIFEIETGKRRGKESELKLYEAYEMI